MPQPQVGVSPLTVEKVLRIRHGGRKRYEDVPTNGRGLTLRLEKDSEPDLVSSTIGELATEASDYIQAYNQLQDVTKEKNAAEQNILDIVQEHPGIRGIKSERENYSLTIFPKNEITYAIGGLKKVLKGAYSRVVDEDVKANISIAPDITTENGKHLSSQIVIDAVCKTLRNLGITASDIKKLVRTNIEVTVDESQLLKMLDNKQIESVEEVGTVKTSYSIKPKFPLRESGK